MGPIKIAIGDMVITFMWVFCASTFGLLSSLIATAIGVQTVAWAPIVIITVIVFVFVFIFGIIGEFLGGASFNPTGTAAFYAAGVGDDSLISMALRFPAQVKNKFVIFLCFSLWVFSSYGILFDLIWILLFFFIFLNQIISFFLGLILLIFNSWIGSN